MEAFPFAPTRCRRDDYLDRRRRLLPWLCSTNPLCGPPVCWPRQHSDVDKVVTVCCCVPCSTQASGEAFGYNGPHETAYEADFVAMMGGNGYADGVNSGTSAIFACLGALSLAPGSEVIVPAISDPGAAMPAALLNCVPVVADTTDYSYNTGPAEIERVISPRTGAIVVAHLAGEMADIENIMALANNYGIPVIEDCAQAHGAVWKDGRPAGSFGSLAAFSTMSGKHHATGAQGGVVYTKDEALYWEAKRFADRGKPLQPVAS